MSDNTSSSWLKKTGPYGRISLRRSGFHGPVPAFNSSMSMQQLDVELSFKRPPPRKSCLLSADRRRLFQNPKEKSARPEMRFSTAGRPSAKPVSKLPLKNESGPSLKHPRQSFLPPRSIRPKPPLVRKQPPKQDIPPQETPLQVYSTPHEPVQSILRSGRRPLNSSAAAKRVNFDGLDGIEPLQISEILPSNENFNNTTKVDAATNTDPPFPPMDLDKLPEMMQSMLSLCGSMQSFLQRFDGLTPTTLLSQLQRPKVLKPVFLENLEDISEGSENLTPTFNNENIPPSTGSSLEHKTIVADSILPSQAETATQIEPNSGSDQGVSPPKVVKFSPVVQTHEFILPDNAKAENDPVPSKIAKLDENIDPQSSDSDEEPPSWPEPKYAVDITPVQARRSARLVGITSPAILLRDGHRRERGGRCNRKFCC